MWVEVVEKEDDIPMRSWARRHRVFLGSSCSDLLTDGGMSGINLLRALVDR